MNESRPHSTKWLDSEMFGFTCTVFFFQVLNISGLSELVGVFCLFVCLSQKIRFLSFVMKEEKEEELEGGGRGEEEKKVVDTVLAMHGLVFFPQAIY